MLMLVVLTVMVMVTPVTDRDGGSGVDVGGAL